MTNKIQHSTRALLFISLIFLALHTQAQDWKNEKKVNILFGLTQPLVVKGFNIEGNYIHNRLIFDYSHGVSLDFSENTLTTALKNQNAVVHVPWTTGLGVGYRLKEWINVRVEPKWHRFEFHYNGEPQNAATQITSYNTFSLGLGVYGNYQPFKNSGNFLKGITIAPSIRYWPTLNSTLPNDKFSYKNKLTNKTEEITTLDPGVGFTPLVVNISVGYSFDLRKKK